MLRSWLHVALLPAIAACSSPEPSIGSSTSGGGGGGSGPTPPCEPPSPVLFSGAVWGGNVAVAGGEVYFTTFQDAQGQEDHAVRKVSSCGGAPTVVADKKPGAIFGDGMAVRAGRVYWSEALDASPTPGVLTAPVSSPGATPTLLATFHTQLAAYQGVAVDDTRVYAGNQAEIISVPLAGGAATTLYSGNVSWGTVLRGSTLYFTADGALRRISTTGGAPGIVAPVAGPSGQFDADANDAYLSSNDSILRVALDGSGSTVLASGLDAPGNVVLAGGYVVAVVTHGASPALVRIPIQGGAAETLYEGLGAGGNQMAVDGSSVYVAFCCGASTGEVLRIDL